MNSLEKNNIPAGYKDSAVGIIPQEWEVTTLGKLGKVMSGLTYSPNDISDTGILVLRSSNIQNGMLCMVDNVYVNTVSYNPVKTGDILICVRNGSKNLIGKSAYITPHYDGVAFGAFMSVYRSTHNNYLKHLFNSDIFYKNVHRNLGATINSINGNDLKKFIIPIPPIAEQRKIAEILRVWDEAIEKQSRLIERLELRKRALMQRLLTGRTRLPDFIDDVQYKKLKPFIVEKSERNTNQTYTNVLSVTNNRGFINQAEQFDREVASDNTAKYKLVHRGQFAYNPSRVNVGSLDLLQTYDLGILSPMYIVFETRPTMDPKFLYYQLKSGWFVGHIPMYVQGSVRDSLSFDGLENIKFWIPSLTEQKAIAEVLTTADDEIATHRKKLDSLRLQKRGLMQQLLTGKTRVKI